MRIENLRKESLAKEEYNLKNGSGSTTI